MPDHHCKLFGNGVNAFPRCLARSRSGQTGDAASVLHRNPLSYRRVINGPLMRLFGVSAGAQCTE